MILWHIKPSIYVICIISNHPNSLRIHLKYFLKIWCYQTRHWNFTLCTLKQYIKGQNMFPSPHYTPLSTGLLYPKLWAQTSGIIQKLYETKTNTNTGWFKSVNWLFSEIKPKMWDFPRFCSFSAKNGLKCKMTFR